MKKLGWAIILIVLVGAVGISFYLNKENFAKKNKINEEKLYDLTLEEKEIITALKHDRQKFESLLSDLQTIPEAVVDLNCKIMRISYKLEDKGKVAISDENLKLLGSVQRLYYSEELLKNNTEDEFYAALEKDVRKWNEDSSFIIEYEIREPIIITGDDAVIDVRYVLNGIKSDDIYQQYILKEYDGHWYIDGWRGINELEYKSNK